MKRSSSRSDLAGLRRWHAERERALELLTIDDAAWEALSAVRRDFALAKSRNDDEALLRFVDYSAELLTPPDPNAAENDWTDWTGVPDARGDADRDSFFLRYARAKAASPLKTQQQIAAAAGLSPTTVHAVEAGRIRPQFRTIEKLAAAFGIPVTDLLGSLPNGRAASPTTDNGHALTLAPGKIKKQQPDPADRPSRRRIAPAAARKRSA